MKASIIICLGFVGQETDDVPDPSTGEVGDPALGDEFDHMSPLEESTYPVELVIVDRAWPKRWNRVTRALPNLVASGRVRYVPPKPSELLERGYRATSSMRNAGAICSSGELLMFVDDYCLLNANTVAKVVKASSEDNVLLHPTIFPFDRSEEVFGDHNPGVYMATREQFMATGGFEENFDGAYGEEDTEWEMRLDRVLRQELAGGPLKRVRRPGVMFPRTKHHNGWYPVMRPSIMHLRKHPYDLDPPWDAPAGMTEDEENKWNGNLRCNKALLQQVYYPELLENARVAGNVAIGPDGPIVNTLREKRACSPECPFCNRPDREQQIMSYSRFQPDQHIVRKMQAATGVLEGKAGKMDPWTMVR
jgi:hypothetical protein